MTINDEDDDVSLDSNEEEEGDENQNSDVEINSLEVARTEIEEALHGWEAELGETNVWRLEASKRRSFWNIVVEKAKEIS